MFLVNYRNLLRRITCEKKIRTIFLSGCQKDEDSKNQAAKKLNSLLQSIIKDDSISKKAAPGKIEIATTKFKKRKIKKEVKPKNLGEKIVEAAKDVAENIKGEPALTEAELLQKLLYKNENLQKSVLAASKNQTLSELISEMKIEQKSPGEKKKIRDAQYSRADHVRNLLEDKSSAIRRKVPADFSQDIKLDLFGDNPLNIFKPKAESEEDEVKLKIWEHCRAREIRLSVTHPPANIYEQMIIWTDRGMMWKFPIDNEQGLDEEKKVSFADHVFLETHLEDWCPEHGPIRHFMELVCVGLSRNHWLTAKEKKDHILWYKDYFLQKKELIKEIGAGIVQLSTSIESSS